MEMQYRLRQEQLLNQKMLNEEILVHSIARLNTRIEKYYRKCKIINAAYEKNIKQGLHRLAVLDKNDYEDYKKKLDNLIEQRKPLMDLLMKGYCLSLETAKQKICRAEEDKLPTYKTIDKILEMLKSGDYTIG